VTFQVILTADAVHDLEEIDAWICTNDSVESADYVLDHIESRLNSLTDMPERGTHPKELSALGNREYREIYFKPYRMIYRVIDDNVYVYLITDGRRDMQALLNRKLLSA